MMNEEIYVHNYLIDTRGVYKKTCKNGYIDSLFSHDFYNFLNIEYNKLLFESNNIPSGYWLSNKYLDFGVIEFTLSLIGKQIKLFEHFDEAIKKFINNNYYKNIKDESIKIEKTQILDNSNDVLLCSTITPCFLNNTFVLDLSTIIGNIIDRKQLLYKYYLDKDLKINKKIVEIIRKKIAILTQYIYVTAGFHDVLTLNGVNGVITYNGFLSLETDERQLLNDLLNDIIIYQIGEGAEMGYGKVIFL